MRRSYFIYAFLLMVFCLSTTAVRAREFCKDQNYRNSGKVSFRDLREKTISKASSLTVDGGQNGGISIKGENRSDILVRACVRTWANTDAEARKIADRIKINTASRVYAANTPKSGWSVSFQILVPKSTGLNLSAHNGGIKIQSVRGNLQFKTFNGGIKLEGVAGNVKGVTQNGGVKVKLSGSSWQGQGLDVETQNGGVKISMSKNYRANIETGTVNGGFKSDFSELKAKRKNRWNRPKRVSASLNGGGAKIRIVTTNGGIKISADEE